MFCVNNNHILLKNFFIKKLLLSYLNRVKNYNYYLLVLFKFIKTGYWIIPKSLIIPHQSHFLENSLYKIPSKVDKYLTFRYGNWKKKQLIGQQLKMIRDFTFLNDNFSQ